jgi:hypothetical protein
MLEPGSDSAILESNVKTPLSASCRFVSAFTNEAFGEPDNIGLKPSAIPRVKPPGLGKGLCLVTWPNPASAGGTHAVQVALRCAVRGGQLMQDNEKGLVFLTSSVILQSHRDGPDENANRAKPVSISAMLAQCCRIVFDQ